MDDRQTGVIATLRDEVGDRGVQRGRSERATEGDDQESVLGHSEARPSRRPPAEAIHSEHRSSQRRPREGRPGQCRLREGDGAGRRETGADHARATRTAVVGDNHDRDPQHDGRDDRAEAGVPADGDHDPRPAATEQAHRCQDRAQHERHEEQIPGRQASLEAHHPEQGEGHPGRRHHLGLDPTERPDVVEVLDVVAGCDGPLDHRESGQHMPSSASTGNEEMTGAGAGHDLSGCSTRGDDGPRPWIGPGPRTHPSGRH